MSATKQRCMLCDHSANAHDLFGCAYHIPALNAGRTIVGSNRCPCSMSRSEIGSGWDHRAIQIAVANGVLESA